MSLNRYRYSRRIASGGMAEVLLARQQGMGGFEKLVVIKRILPQLKNDGTFVDMFLNEARLAASLRHPNIIEIYDVIRDANEFAIVMEYLSGETVRFILSECRRNRIPIPINIACRLVASAAAGLAHAHEALGPDDQPVGIVHRDVSPNNIIVTYDGTTKLLDFGIARANVNNIYTQPGVIKGKYSYCSPEQVQRKSLDARSDIFSLGIVLYELLTRRKLFGGKDPGEILKAVMERRIPPASQLNSDVPPELDQVALTALDRNLASRTQRAAQIRDDLEGIIQHYRMPASPSHVARWLDTTFPNKKRQRQQLERDVVSEGGGASMTGIHRLPTAGLGGSAVRDPAAQWSHASSVGVGSLSGSQPQTLASVGAPVEQRPMARLMLLSSLITVIFVALLAVAFWFGRQTLPEAAQAPVTVGSSASPVESDLPDSVALHLHVVPRGAKVSVDGEELSNLIDEDGVLIPAAPNVEVELQVTKPGYRTHELQLRSPKRGTKNVYVTLYKESVPEPVEEAPEPSPPPEQRASRTRIRRRVQTPRAPRTATLLVDYSPRDATLYVDGERIRGRSPARVEDLEQGRYTVRLVRDGYRSVERSVSLSAGSRRNLSVSMTAIPKPARIDVITTPNGAAVQVDGKPRGRSPLIGLLLKPDMTHTFEVRRSGYEPWRTEVRLEEGTNPPVVANLTPSTPPPQRPADSTSGSDSDISVAIDRKGDEKVGQALFRSKCGECHGSTAPAVRARRYSSEQWARYFAFGRHIRHSKLGDSMNATELAHIKTYLMSVAADQRRVRAAGVRE